MRAQRLLAIQLLLQLRGRQTAEALAEQFEVSVRTIYRDIDALSAAGIPVRSDSGPGGGFALIDGYRTRLTGLASPEAEALFLIGLPGPAAALGLGAAAAQAARKLLAALPPGIQLDAERIAARFHLDPADWYQASDAAPQLPAIARAVLDQRQLALRYQSWSGVRDWQVDPLGLVLKGGAWYLVARSGERSRIYKVSAVQALQTLDTPFQRPPDFDLAHWWASELAAFEARLRPATASVRASASGLQRLCRLGAYAEQAVQDAPPPDISGWTTVELPVEDSEQALLQLLGIGAELEVLAPPALRDALCALLAQMQSRYQPAEAPNACSIGASCSA